MQLPQLNDVDLDPVMREELEYKHALKHGLLFSSVQGEEAAIVQQETLSDSLNHLAKLDEDFPIYLVDSDSYTRLKNKYLEIQTGSAFDEMEAASEELFEAESDLLEFIQNSQDLLNSEESAPIIKMVNSLFFQAIKRGASDIHIEAHERRGEVRFRVNGALTKHLDLDKNVTTLVVNRIKVISGLDISEKRIPQDGRTQVSISGKTLDVRVSVLPTYYGERIVMRILMQSGSIPSLEELGFREDLTAQLYKLITHSHGMILVTGPTGSGKSTTLHSFLQYLSSPDKNIITVEDPVEYNSDEISQIQVNDKVGLTFAAGLRSILRQDPDIVMVGEIRDTETARIAIQAALTGHLMLSTLHTNDATSALSRLADMEVEPFLISSTLLGVLAQRLARTLCTECKHETTLPPQAAHDLDLPQFGHYFKAVGCPACDFTGYKGRQAVGELFVLNDAVKVMMKDGINDHQIREAMRAQGMRTISDELKEMLVEGIISYEEAIRVGLMDN